MKMVLPLKDVTSFRLEHLYYDEYIKTRTVMIMMTSLRLLSTKMALNHLAYLT